MRNLLPEDLGQPEPPLGVEAGQSSSRFHLYLARLFIGSGLLIGSTGLYVVGQSLKPAPKNVPTSTAVNFMGKSTYASGGNVMPGDGLNVSIACNIQENSRGIFSTKQGGNNFVNPRAPVAYTLALDGVTNTVVMAPEVYTTNSYSFMGVVDILRISARGNKVRLAESGDPSNYPPFPGTTISHRYDLGEDDYHFGRYDLLDYDIARLGGHLVLAVSCNSTAIDHIIKLGNSQAPALPPPSITL